MINNLELQGLYPISVDCLSHTICFSKKGFRGGDARLSHAVLEGVVVFSSFSLFPLSRLFHPLTVAVRQNLFPSVSPEAMLFLLV